MTVYPMSTNSMPVFLYISLIEEVYTYQNPELLIIDIRPFTQDCEDTNRMDSKARLLLDVMEPFSINRIKAGIKTMEAIKFVEPDKSAFDLSLFFSFIKFHSRWVENSFSIQDNLGDVEHNYLGFYLGSKLTIKQKVLEPKPYNPDSTYDLDPLAEKVLYELFDYIRENDLNVLFIDTPQVKGPHDTGRSNLVYKLVEEEGFDCIHYYTDKDPEGISIDFDFSTEFYNSGHVNFYGATKFTDIFADYLNENYDLPDRRNDEKVKKDWDGVQEKLLKKIEELEQEKLLKELAEQAQAQ